MKIDEAVKKIIDETNRVRAKVDDNNNLIIASSNRPYQDWFLLFPANVTSWNRILEVWNSLDHVTAQDLARVMDVIQRLLDTPVEERFSEKKYRLRWIDSKVQEGPATYLGRTGSGDSIYWSTFSVVGAEIFTESELEQLKKDNPLLAPAIDAMKEPAEDIEHDND
ncbi:hypothetical protein LMB33_05240 [Limosilactobacillus reuteri]|uniref:hypothetical protein n=1 Tax=Limosilactobacillus reuteri TaxID=1598 RepID=UPI001E57E2A9|nr:hypothetical protein [Limosilactobacillus reuteri]MCC4326457.1 hypothetical protein [Limosilactobacillus reuteri]MCC4329776.1 hypothetical protein [Limosilactobacillus reuteri]